MSGQSLMRKSPETQFREPKGRLIFSSDFESGNLESVDDIDVRAPEVHGVFQADDRCRFQQQRDHRERAHRNFINMGHSGSREILVAGHCVLPRCGLLPAGVRPDEQAVVREPGQLEADVPLQGNDDRPRDVPVHHRR